LARQELVDMRRNLGFIFQAHNLFDSLSAYENVKMALQLGDCAPAEMRQRGVAMLERLGLGHRVDYKPRSLSGGQRQRVAVARALVNRPKLVLADEPTASLDKESSTTVVNLLKELTVKEACTVIMVTHDNRILELADRIVNMVDGRIVSNVVLRTALIICEFLKTVDPFKQLTPAEIANVADRMATRKYNSGEVIIRQGDPGEEFFLIGRGTAAVTKKTPREPERRVATLQAGDIFGEMALLMNEVRNATVQAIDEMEVYCLSKQDFHEALERSVGFRDQIRQIYFDRYAMLRIASM
jgi:putative ABC transport system ATP-binding protein